MTERDRLIELLSATHTETDNYKEQARLHDEYIADQLLANGVVVPPCKVGDTVYVEFNEKVIQGTVRLIRPFILKEETVFKGNVICEIDSLFYDDGRKEEHELYVVFEKPYGMERVAYLTKEKAEAKLKEREAE
jgi:hypothetical protein